MQMWFVWAIVSLLVLTIAGLIGIDLWWTNQPQRQARRARNHAPISSNPDPTTTTSMPPDIEKGWHPDNQHHNSKERIYWAWTLGLTGAVAIGAFASAYYSYCSAYQARRQADIAQADQRPWIGAPVITSDTCDESGGLHPTPTESFSFNLKFKNIGRMPAHRLFIVANIGTESQALATANQFCARAIQVHQNTGQVDLSIAPSDAYVGHIFVSDPGVTRDFSSVPFEDIPSPVDKPSIFGCTVYQSLIDGRSHKSIFLAAIVIHNSASGGIAICVNDSYSISPD